MAFASTTQKRIADILHLDREQYSDQSTLRALMDNVETFDGTENTTIVQDIEVLVQRIESLNNVVDDALEDEGTGIRSERVQGLYDVEYYEGASRSAGTSRIRQGLVARLKTLIDPDKMLDRVMPGGLILW